jgi:cobalamin biosynthesis Mg chelatase CobN
MPVTIAPIDQYSADWSEADTLASQASAGTDGTGVTLSSSDVWLADGNAIAQQIQTGNEVLLSDLSPELTPNLVDNTDVANANVIAASSGSLSLGDTASNPLSGDTAIEQGDLSFSLDVNGSTSGSTTSGFGSGATSSSSSGSGLNEGSPLITAVSTTATGVSTSSSGSAIPGAVESPSSISGGGGTEVISSDGSVVTVDGSAANPSAGSSSAAVPMEFSPGAGLLLMVAVVLFRQLRWQRFKHELLAN